jgi:hypothetical protein
MIVPQGIKLQIQPSCGRKTSRLLFIGLGDCDSQITIFH